MEMRKIFLEVGSSILAEKTRAYLIKEESHTTSFSMLSGREETALFNFDIFSGTEDANFLLCL